MAAANCCSLLAMPTILQQVCVGETVAASSTSAVTRSASAMSCSKNVMSSIPHGLQFSNWKGLKVGGVSVSRAFKPDGIHVSQGTFGRLGSGRVAAVDQSSVSTGAPSKIPATSVEEVVYDPMGRYNELLSDLQRSGSIPRTYITLFSPSKINLFLRITGKRQDGYHDLASLFHVISLGDIIKFSVSPSNTKDSLTTNVLGVPLDENNLIIKALNLYRKKTGSSTHFWIHLDKRVPTGAGLGGGSGNAATALWAANQLNGGLATEKELQEWSGEIGSDIPFFFSTGAAYCTSRGEVVRNIPPPIPLSTPMVLMKPQEECGTADVYKALRLEDCSSTDPEKLLESIVQNGITQNVCVNDLEKPAFKVLPTLKQLKERISAASRGHYQAVFMSGSGSTIVGIGDSQPPEFLYDEEQYNSVFISEAYFLTRRENEWYEQPVSEGSQT